MTELLNKTAELLRDNIWVSIAAPEDEYGSSVVQRDEYDLAEIILKVIGAPIWEEGYEAGYEDQRYRDTTKRRPPNPYEEVI